MLSLWEHSCAIALQGPKSREAIPDGEGKVWKDEIDPAEVNIFKINKFNSEFAPEKLPNPKR